MPFPTTRSSVVLALTSEHETDRARALEIIAEIYWRPLYKYARLAHSRAPIDAEDLTQGFLARMVEKDALATYDRGRGSFRTFVRTLFDRYVANEVKAAHRIKRGGEVVAAPFDSAESEVASDKHVRTPEEVFETEWARAVFSVAIERVRDRLRPDDFAMFEAYDLDDSTSVSYRDLAERFALNVTTVTNRLAAARRLFRETVLEILRDATASDTEYRAEVRALLGAEP